jgi:hypothetical protein
MDAMINEKVKCRLDRAFGLTHDLVAHLEERSLSLALGELPANRIASQLWCVVGARESYERAIAAGGWQGFACSLREPRVKPSVLAALAATRERLNRIDYANLNELQTDLALDLLEHELQHHGQLIRFVYGNGLGFPASWSARYTV